MTMLPATTATGTPEPEVVPTLFPRFTVTQINGRSVIVRSDTGLPVRPQAQIEAANKTAEEERLRAWQREQEERRAQDAADRYRQRIQAAVALREARKRRKEGPPPPTWQEVAAWIEQSGLSQRDIQERTGIHRSTVARIVSGKQPDHDQPARYKLADFFRTYQPEQVAA